MYRDLVLLPTTYAESQLAPYGYRVAARSGEVSLTLERGERQVEFTCACPAFPLIKALGCPMHHPGPGGSWPVHHEVELAKNNPGV